MNVILEGAQAAFKDCAAGIVVWYREHYLLILDRNVTTPDGHAANVVDLKTGAPGSIEPTALVTVVKATCRVMF